MKKACCICHTIKDEKEIVYREDESYCKECFIPDDAVISITPLGVVSLVIKEKLNLSDEKSTQIAKDIMIELQKLALKWCENNGLPAILLENIGGKFIEAKNS